ncbi:MAG: OmpA family protein [Gammaproteobacteria bacterium]|nr:OmpA family protein [Gammaproteobacteria bacterium]
MNKPITVLFAACMLSLAWQHPAAQEADDVLSSDDIVEALEQSPPPATRSLTRGFAVKTRKSVDLDIPFEYNSSELAPEARQQLLQLSHALTSEQLGHFRFEIAGHTDASGAEEYNRSLSERRAEAVREFLIQQGVKPEKLQSVGLGEERLLMPDDPRNSRNRRVEIRNLGEDQ